MRCGYPSREILLLTVEGGAKAADERAQSPSRKKDEQRDCASSDACIGAIERCECRDCNRGAACARYTGAAAAKNLAPPIDDRAAIARRLLELRIEHRDLDEVIARLDATSDMDDLQLRRLKKRKLRIKDQMNQLENALIPDQPA